MSPVQGTAPPVYLLREKARGRAGAGLHSNQVQFMQLMGLVDPGPAECEDVTEWECPLSEEEAQMFVTASRHLYFPNICREDENDGLLYDGRVSLAVGIPADQVPQCDCIAHERLKQQITENESDDLKSIIRSASLQTADAGCNYACALLRRLFVSMGNSKLRGDFGVSYTLLCADITSGATRTSLSIGKMLGPAAYL